jgi:acetyl-CoA carboxylase carboxyltransferase component
MESKIEELNDKIAQAHLGGGKDRIAKQHQKKKLTARERVDYLMDEGSFEEIGVLSNTRLISEWQKSCITVMVSLLDTELLMVDFYVLLRILPFWWGTL